MFVCNENKHSHRRLSKEQERGELELAQKNGLLEFGNELILDAVACSKATGLTNCHVEWNRMG